MWRMMKGRGFRSVQNRSFAKIEFHDDCSVFIISLSNLLICYIASVLASNGQPYPADADAPPRGTAF